MEQVLGMRGRRSFIMLEKAVTSEPLRNHPISAGADPSTAPSEEERSMTYCGVKGHIQIQFPSLGREENLPFCVVPAKEQPKVTLTTIHTHRHLAVSTTIASQGGNKITHSQLPI